jgi:hypothetical protein
MCHKFHFIGFFLVLLILPGVRLATAATINVPGDQGTIQAGINAANNGDDVVVAAGTYMEAINFFGKAITVRSASGEPGDTIIDGNGADHVVRFVSGEDPNTVLSGVTITGGIAGGSHPDNNGGGIFCINSSPLVTQCIISGNVTTLSGNGGGIYCDLSGATMIRCTITQNLSDRSGGGFYCNDSAVTFSDCSIVGNTADFEGGGFYSTDSTITITRSTFLDNIALGTGGGGLFSNDCQATISDTFFLGNSASGGSGSGGGLYSDFGRLWVTHCIFSGNVVLGVLSVDGGGGCYFRRALSATVSHCAFDGNVTQGLGSSRSIYNDGSYLHVSNSILWENDGLDPVRTTGTNDDSLTVARFSVLQLHGFAGTGVDHEINGGGNIDTDPLFVDADGADNIIGTLDDNLRLQAGSPCIDAGVTLTTQFDLDGNQRTVDDPATADTGIGSPAVVDMGAYEFGSSPPPCNNGLEGDIDCNGIVDLFDHALLAANWLETP